VDCGPKTPKADAGEKIILPSLRRLGVDSVDLILLSHPDLDHIGGTGSVIKNYPNATIAVSRCFSSNKQLLGLLREWHVKSSRIKWLGPELKGRVGDFEIRIDCPQTDPDEETNDGSMIVRIAEGQASAVFSGDAPAKIEEAFDRVADWRAEVMKAGHHGSRTATSQEWLDSVKPEYVVLSCGINNEYRHPHKEVVERLERDGVKICRTDREGDITFGLRNGRFERE
jgi:competence protein ComEC